ncbi:MAG: hypothetical protein WC335_07025 [Candidatus Omnitrophota bacterium]|jgi:hypothetical protein
MMETGLKKNLIISLVCHAGLFLVLGLSFGRPLAPLNYSPVSFWGQILQPYDFARTAAPLRSLIETKAVFFRNIGDMFAGHFVSSLSPGADTAGTFIPGTPAIKPEVVSLRPVKLDLTPSIALPVLPKRREPALTFHPLLPQHFPLYFKDRQTAHIEIMFNIASTHGDEHAVVMQRKISSGNLEADLLSMRYIGHYLFIQEKRFAPDKWQTVKIDLSP